MNRLVSLTVALLGLALLAASPTALAAPSKGKKVHCKKGEVRKRKHGKWVCVKRPAQPTPTPGLDILAAPGTYKGSHGVTVTSSKTEEGANQISITVAFPNGYVSCHGRPPYPGITVSVADMLVTDYGEFAGSSGAGGAYVVIEGHFTGPNTLTLENAGASNVRVHGERCAAQYKGAKIVF